MSQDLYEFAIAGQPRPLVPADFLVAKPRSAV